MGHSKKQTLLDPEYLPEWKSATIAIFEEIKHILSKKKYIDVNNRDRCINGPIHPTTINRLL